jgi:hypothetical protein
MPELTMTALTGLSHSSTPGALHRNCTSSWLNPKAGSSRPYAAFMKFIHQPVVTDCHTTNGSQPSEPAKDNLITQCWDYV